VIAAYRLLVCVASTADLAIWHSEVLSDMSRIPRVRFWRSCASILVLGLLALAGCDSLFGDDGKQGGLVVMDGGVCIKDREVLSSLLGQPQACANSNQCPGGSFCDTAAGRCDWDCFADSDCGAGFTCSCEGRCEAAGTGGDAGPPADPTCARDLAALDDIEDRSCLRDEHCALGSRCDAVTRRCTLDCTADSECAAGTVCDCRGACVAPGAAAPVPPTTKPSTTVTPTYVVVPPGGAWGVQTVSVRIASEAALPAGVVPVARVEVLDPDGLGHLGLTASAQAGETVATIAGISFSTREEQRALQRLATATAAQIQSDLLVGADAATAIIARRPLATLQVLVDARLVEARGLQRLKSLSDSATAAVCTAEGRVRTLAGTDWVVDSAASGYAAVASVAVGRCLSASDETVRQVAISTYLATRADTTQIVRHLDYQIVDLGTKGATSDAATTATGMYEGTIVVTGRGQGEVMNVPVHAWATRSDRLVLFDDLSLLSAHGRIVLGASATYVVAVDPSGTGSRGQLTAKISDWIDDGGRNGIRTGRFNITLGPWGRPQAVVYALRRTGLATHALSGAGSALATARACSSSVACATGTSCTTALADSGATDATAGRCVPGAASTVSTLVDTIEHPTEAAWRQAGTFLDPLHYNYRNYNDYSDCNGSDETCTDSDRDRPSSLGERLLCYAYGAEHSPWGSQAASDSHPLGISRLIRLDEAMSPHSVTPIERVQGDLSCRNVVGALPASGPAVYYGAQFSQTAVPLVTGARAEATRQVNGATERSVSTFHPLATQNVTARQRLQTCLADLARPIPNIQDDSDPYYWSITTAREHARTWFGTGSSCVNLAQVVPALGSFALRMVDASDDRARLGTRSGPLFQRLLAQWLDVHAFVAQQGVQEREASASLDAGGAISSDAPPDLVAIMDTVERGWDILLDGTYARALSTLTATHLRTPDPRVMKPSAYWSFDAADVSATHIRDLVGDNHLNAPAGSVAFENGAVRKTSASAVSISSSKLVAPLGDTTVSFWLNTSTLPVADAVIFRNPNALTIEIKNAVAGGWRIAVGHFGISRQTAQLGAPAFPAGWHHIVVTRTGAFYYITINGLEPSIDGESGGGRAYYPTENIPLLSPTTSVLGGSTNVTIDELSIWEHALGPNEVGVLRTRGRTPSAATRLAPINTKWDAAATLNDPNHEQAIGLATKIVDTAANHANLIETYADDSLAAVYGSCYLGGESTPQRTALDRASKGLRYLSAVESIASDLYQRASEVPCTGTLECTAAGATSCGGQGVCLDAAGERFFSEPAWGPDYRAALTRFVAARGRAVAETQRLGRCENPLGIPEEDLPLYFGDVTGDNARFFASSDYLMDRWAGPAVDEAAAALTDARASWQSMRQSNVQQLMNEHEAARRLEGLMTGFVKPIIEACGISDRNPADVLPAFANRELTAQTCFRTPSCSGNSPACVRGQMGDAALGMKGAMSALRTEERQQERRRVEWQAQTDSCERVSRSIGGDLQAIADYKEKAKEARRQSKGFLGRFGGFLDDTFNTDFFEDAMGYINACLTSGASAAQAAAPAGPYAAAGAAAAGCIMGLAGEDAQQGVRNLEEAKDTLQQTLTQSELLRTIDACWDEVGRRARDVEYGIDFSRQQLVAYEQARFKLDELIRSTDRNVKEAAAILEREAGRTLPSIAHGFWTDEKIARYRRELEQARRMTFLAMRAAEFELQQSLGVRSAILTATRPDQLEEVVDRIDAERAARTLNGRRPAEGTEVLSLRTDILGLHDVAAREPGERSDSSTARLQQILTSPDYAMWDDQGQYLGQGIPFKLRESGALRHRCAERLWRVSATVQGDLTDVEQPGTHVFLLKNNVFQSQWCDGRGDGSDYQQASTSHTTNLFQGGTAGDDERSEYTTAVMYPWFNVRRGDFYRDAYTEGSSEELAGRGLYGEYVLLFPYAGMLEPDASCNAAGNASCADPFRDLREVEDVLIRFDYYSVDNLAL
jgi:hypothetical protein